MRRRPPPSLVAFLGQTRVQGLVPEKRNGLGHVAGGGLGQASHFVGAAIEVGNDDLVLPVDLVFGLLGVDSGAVGGPDALEQPLGLRSRGQSGDQGAARPSTQQSDLLRMTPEVLDVSGDPTQSADDVAHAVVAGGFRIGSGGEWLEREEAQNAPSVIDVDKHDPVFLGQGRIRPQGFLFFVAQIVPADVDHDRHEFVVDHVAGEHVQGQAVFVADDFSVRKSSPTAIRIRFVALREAIFET